jgi:signal transduction histidine kinase
MTPRLLTRPGWLLRTLAMRWFPRRTVRLRLTALYGSLFLVAGALLLAITYALVASHVDASATVRASSDKGRVSIVATAIGGRLPPLAVPGQAGAQTAGGPSRILIQPPAASSGPKVTEQIPQKYARQAGVLLRAALARQRSSELSQLLLWSGAALGLMAILSIALGWWMAGRVLVPLRRMTATAREISAENLHERLALCGPDDELKELGDTVDGLLARLERAFDAQRLFVANASHELRTPLTLQRAMVEVALADPRADAAALRTVCERVLVAGEQQERLIEALLTLARADRGLDVHEQVDLEHEVREALAAAQAAANGSSPKITTELRIARVWGDRRLIARLAANVIDNAMRHNTPGGWIRIVTGTGDDGRAGLIVANSGRVLEADDVPALTEPFRRAAAGRTHDAGSGYGLGLSIAHAIVGAHGGTLRLSARPDGGLEVEVRLPSVALLQLHDLRAAAPADDRRMSGTGRPTFGRE